MKPTLETYKLKKWTVFGRTTFKPPFKIKDGLINEARIVHVVQGRSRLFSANQHLDLKSGDTLIMKADNFVNCWIDNEDDKVNSVIAFQLNADFLSFLYSNQVPDWFSPSQETEFNSVEKVEKSTVLDSFLQNLMTYLDTPVHLTEEIISLKIKELISIMVQTDRRGKVIKIFRHLFSSREFDFQEVVQKHLFDDLNIEDLAFLTSMSVSSFKRKFTSVYGTSPNKYIISKRLEKAQILLNTTNQRISEIAYDCGYSDISHFSKTFKSYYNISPSDLRKERLG